MAELFIKEFYSQLLDFFFNHNNTFFTLEMKEESI